MRSSRVNKAIKQFQRLERVSFPREDFPRIFHADIFRNTKKTIQNTTRLKIEHISFNIYTQNHRLHTPNHSSSAYGNRWIHTSSTHIHRNIKSSNPPRNIINPQRSHTHRSKNLANVQNSRKLARFSLPTPFVDSQPGREETYQTRE